ncbi:alpha/beta fold hydrolase [Streptomyces sp. NPDC097619]|uniref:alpha/beta fold hydrolase n=1 Tax=Streptomyces sp. NPDC097619 TaxID=3157228 RepID=UPI003332EFC8
MDGTTGATAEHGRTDRPAGSGVRRTVRRAGLAAAVAAVVLSALPWATAGSATAIAADRAGITTTVTGTTAGADPATWGPVPGTARVGGSGPRWCPPVPGHRVDCGTVDRPLVAGQPALGRTTVAYAVVRHRDPGAAKGTVAVNPGGPGEVAVDRAADFAGALHGLLGDHDLLLVDPRGTGRSQRLPCGLTDAEYRFGGRAEQREAVARCARTLGPRARAYTTAATADDIDAVRALIGARQLSLYGLSYGTYLMPVYASRHPERVRNIVLSGAYPLGFDPLAGSSARAVSLALHRICERSAVPGGGRACEGGEAVRNLATTAARLRARPMPVTVEVAGVPRRLLFTEGKLSNLAFEGASRAVGIAPGEPSLLGSLPHALDRFVLGDRDPLTRLVREEYAGATTEDQAPYVAVVCNDYRRAWDGAAPEGERWRQYRAAVAGAAPGSFGAFSGRGFLEGPTDGGDVCIGWPRALSMDPQPTRPALPNVPVLVLSGDLDANTTAHNSRIAARQFERSRFFSVPNTGHVPELEPGGCVVGVTATFLRTSAPGDTSCLRGLPAVTVTPVRR